MTRRLRQSFQTEKSHAKRQRRKGQNEEDLKQEGDGDLGFLPWLLFKDSVAKVSSDEKNSDCRCVNSLPFRSAFVLNLCAFASLREIFSVFVTFVIFP
jgi:hypothetical protein